MSTKRLSADVDYYDLLGVSYNSTLKEVQRAYRQKALTVHPDKNPSPDAAVLFHALFQAYDVLSDPQAKLAYDELLKARMAKKKKNEAMDSKRRAMKDDLEGRENTAKKQKMDEKEAEANLQTELERLRADGARRRMEKEEELRKQMTVEEPNPVIEEPMTLTKPGDLDCALKIKWKRKKHSLEAAELEAIFSIFGPVDSVAVSSKKQGSALVVFKTVVSAHAALTSKGTNPRLDPFDSIDWAGGSEPAIVKKMNATVVAPSVSSGGVAGGAVPATKITASTAAAAPSPSLFAAAPSGVSAFGTVPSFVPPSFGSAPAAVDDYETITLMKMRRAERERLGRDIREKEAAESELQDEK